MKSLEISFVLFGFSLENWGGGWPLAALDAFARNVILRSAATKDLL